MKYSTRRVFSANAARRSKTKLPGMSARGSSSRYGLANDIKAARRKNKKFGKPAK